MLYINKIQRALQLIKRFFGVARQQGLKAAITTMLSHPAWSKITQTMTFLPKNQLPKDFHNPFHGVYSYHCQHVEKRAEHDNFAIATASKGNFFMAEIAQLVGCALEELGSTVTYIDEYSFDRVLPHQTLLIVAPHEFFVLGDTHRLTKQLQKVNRTIMLNTEQSQTSWFAKALPFLKMADIVWDMNYQSAVTLRANHLVVYFLPLGYSSKYESKLNLSAPLARSLALLSLHRTVTEQRPENYHERPIDILFVGTLSEKRKLFFAKQAAFFAQYECFIYLPDGNTPFLMHNDATIDFEQMSKLAQRSKIMINIHRDNNTYLEWQRIVNLGILQGCLVISESCDQTPALNIGLDYVDVPLELIPETCKYYLNNQQIAEDFSHRAQTHVQDLKMADTLNKLLATI